MAIQLVDGIDHRGSLWSLLFVALVFGVLNASIRPVLKLLSLPVIILTLGLFIFVINALMLMMTGWVSGVLNLGFYVAGFWDAFFGGLIVSVVSLVLVAVHRASGRRKCTWSHERFAAERDLQQLWRLLPASDHLKPARQSLRV